MTFQNTLRRSFIAHGAARVLAVEVREVAETTRQSHALSAEPAQLAAEGAAAAALFSAYLKGEARVSVQIQLEKPQAAFIADVRGNGEMRARLTPGHFKLPSDGKLSGAMLVIQGSAEREIYRGTSMIDHTSLQGALANHLRTSSQVDVALRIAADLGEGGEVRRALGVLVERLPIHEELPSLSPEAFYAQFANVETMSPAALEDAFESGVLAGSEMSALDERPVLWRCGCSQERVETMIQGLGPVEMRDMLARDGGAEVTCHFCNTRYAVSADRLGALIEEAEEN